MKTLYNGRFVKSVIFFKVQHFLLYYDLAWDNAITK